MTFTHHTSEDHSNGTVEVTGLFASIQSFSKSRFILSPNPLVSRLATTLRTSSLALLFALGAPVLAAQSHTITVTSSNTFTVPSGVSTLIVEGWGGGGGGSYAGGGGGGSYFRIVLSVTAGGTLTLSPGAAGVAGASGSYGSNGGNTTMAYKSGSTTINCTAVGGFGSQFLVALNDYYGYYCTGPTINGIPLAYTGSTGHYGETPRTIAIGPRSATSYIASITGGNGGDAGNAPGTHGLGNTQNYAFLINTNSASGVAANDPVQSNVSGHISQARPGLVPGGGGGGTASEADPNLPAANGAGGQILITY